MKRKVIPILLLLFLLLSVLLTACEGRQALLDPKDPVTMTMWHVYGSQTESPMNEMVEQFNSTVGEEQGIRINVTSASNSTAIHDALVAAAKGEPGAGELPDLFVCYPKTAIAMGADLLLDWNDYFD